MEKSNHCSCILVRELGTDESELTKTPLVWASWKHPYWAFPGGNAIFRHDLGRMETPLETARRKLLEETGLVAEILKPLDMRQKDTHDWYLFEAPFENLHDLLARSRRGHFVSKFPTAQLPFMRAFLPPHKKVLLDLGIRS